MLTLLIDNKNWVEQANKIDGYHFIYQDLNIPVEQLQRLCQQQCIDFILCVDFTSQQAMQPQQKTILESNIPWLLPNQTSCKMEDKFFAHQWLSSNGFNGYLPASRKLNQFPYVLKTGSGTSSNCVYLINHQQDLDKIKFDQQHYLAQEYLDSVFEYAHHLFAIDGKIIHHVTYQHDFSTQLAPGQQYLRGNGFHNQSISHYHLLPQQLDVFSSIIKNLDYTGFACFDFKLIDEHLYLIEMNSRMGGSLIFYNSVMNDFDDFMKQAMKTLLI